VDSHLFFFEFISIAMQGFWVFSNENSNAIFFTITVLVLFQGLSAERRLCGDLEPSDSSRRFCYFFWNLFQSQTRFFASGSWAE